MPEIFSITRQLADINADQWDSLIDGNPFLSHAFLLALDQANCATPRTGWAPHYLLLHRDQQLAGALPLYLKSHSRGEYVFDYGWAQAFEEHGLEYYPKLLSSVPFTPVPGPRLLAKTHTDRVLLAQQAIALTQQNQFSSLHILFGSQADRVALQEAGFLFRESVQFHWRNQQYQSMDDFLGSMNQQKRKKLKQDRRKAHEAGVVFRWLTGEQIDEETLAFFFKCYYLTYKAHGNTPYLSYDFFARLHRNMPDKLVIVLAEQDGQPIAAALNILGENVLYGRYWGSTKFVSGLHFETCYMQGIEFCIKHKIDSFEGGAQGEHKLSRGLLPVKTYSAHWIRDERYALAIADFLDRETPAIDRYVDELNEHSPFKQNQD